MTCSFTSLARPSRSHPPLAHFFVGLAVLVALAATPALADWQTGVDAFQNGDYDAAETAFRQLVEAQPEWYGGHFMLGRVLVEKGQASAALPALQRALEIEARPEVALLLARTALHEDEASVARDALAGEPPAQLPEAQKVAWLTLRAGAAGSPSGRLQDLEAAASLAPDDLRVRLSVADAAVDAGRLDAAVRHLELARDLDSTDEGVLVRLLKVRLAQADAFSDAAADDAADDAADGAKAAVKAACVHSADAAADLAAVSGKADHLSVAARSYRCADDLERAASYYSRALAADPNWKRAYDLAKLQIDTQDWKSAEATLRPYLETEGEGRPKVHQLVGRALEGQQRFLEAIPHYEIADDQAGIAHAREGQAILDEIEEQEKIEKELRDLQDQIGQLEDDAAGLR